MPTFRVDGDQIRSRSGRRFNLNDLDVRARQLPWVTQHGIIMPRHQYVVKSKLESDSAREAFDLLEFACANHPAGWKAFFRAKKQQQRYLVIGNYRYWYTQIGAARMLNRCGKARELENTRTGDGVRRVRNWNGCDFAWRAEYGVNCENVHQYCNLVAVAAKIGTAAVTVSALCYAAMVSLEDVARLARDLKRTRTLAPDAEAAITETAHGVEPLATARAGPWYRSSFGRRVNVHVPWLKQKDMAFDRVAAQLRWLSGAPRLDVTAIFPLPAADRYLIQLAVPPLPQT